MELFDFLDALFSKEKWKNVTDNDKYKFSFMAHRFISIKYPVEANNSHVVGLGKKNSARIMDHWHRFLSKTYKGKPNWMRTKSGKKQQVKDVLKGVPKEAISKYCSHWQVDSSTLNELIELYPKETKKEIKKFIDT